MSHKLQVVAIQIVLILILSLAFFTFSVITPKSIKSSMVRWQPSPDQEQIQPQIVFDTWQKKNKWSKVSDWIPQNSQNIFLEMLATPILFNWSLVGTIKMMSLQTKILILGKISAPT